MKTILVVEDDKAILQGLELNLAQEGYRVLSRMDGVEGYECARTEQPDLVLLDVMLPSMSGFQICSRLKKENFSSPVFLLTGLSGEEARLQGLDKGADDYISKPFSIRELSLRIRNALKQHEQVQARSKMLEEEFKKARKIQLSSLPRTQPRVRGLDVFGKTIPATQVGGDYFDYLRLDEGKFGVVVADVSGKGMPAALYVQKMQGIVQSSIKNLHSPADILLALQKHLHSSLDVASFVTAVAAVFDVEKQTVEVAQAGHLPVILVRNGRCSLLKPQGVWIGKSSQEMFSKKLETESTVLKKRDLFFFYTDGVPESRNATGDEFGFERLKKTLSASKGNAKQTGERFLRNLQSFCRDEAQADDITMVSVRVTSD